MTSRYRIRQTDTYRKEYEKEFRYSVKNWGGKHADKYFRELESRIKTLEDNPHINAPRPGLPKNECFIFHKGHFVTYKIDDQKKEITMLRMLGRDQFHILEKEVQRQKEQTKGNIERRMEQKARRQKDRESDRDRGDKSR